MTIVPCLKAAFGTWAQRAATVAVISACLPSLALALETDPPPHGLAWNRSGLPATIPLQVKSPSGRNYFLRLVDERHGRTVLAAHIEGGRFFKVLVPPGTFTIHIDFGVVWQDDDTLFGSGDDAGSFVLPEPLTFGVQGVNRKAGYLVALSDFLPDDVPSMEIARQSICQTSQREYSRRFGDRDQPDWIEVEPWELWLETPRYSTRSRYCD